MNDTSCLDGGPTGRTERSGIARVASDREYDERIWEVGTHG